MEAGGDGRSSQHLMPQPSARPEVPGEAGRAGVPQGACGCRARCVLGISRAGGGCCGAGWPEGRAGHTQPAPLHRLAFMVPALPR